jgi:translocation and assembly module TamB
LSAPSDLPPDAPSEAEAEAPIDAVISPKTQRRIGWGLVGMIAGGVLIFLLALLIGGRLAVLSPAGRDLVTSFVAGKRIGDYGRINIEGLTGDLWNDFSIRRVTVTDEEGVWLEANNVRVDWTYWPLVTRRFHATEITADTIRVLRRPVVEASDNPPGSSPIAVDIDKFSANVELLEGFSQEYGRWTLSGEADLPRTGAKSARVAAYSLTRRGDFLRANVTFGDGLENLRINARANEAQGGPLAGALGYSPNQPFLANVQVDGERIDATIRTGDFTPLTVRGVYGDERARISGFADFSGSDLLQPFANRLGRTARFGLASVPDATREGFQGLAWELRSENLTSRARGIIRMSDRTAPEGIQVEVVTPSLSRLAGADLGGPSAYVGRFTGSPDQWRLAGNLSVNGAALASYQATRIAGPLALSSTGGGRLLLEGDLSATGGSNRGMIGGLLGADPRLQMTLARLPSGAILLQEVDLRGQAIAIEGSGSRNLLGGLGFRGRAEITDARRLASGANGAFGGTIEASSARARAPWMIRFDGRGRGLATGMNELDRLLGRTPRLQLAGVLDGGQIAVERAELTGAAGRAGARGLIETGGRLRLALDWNARGPFGVGPIEIDGAATGNGALTGTLAQPRADLRARFDNIATGPLTLTGADVILSFRRGPNASDGRIAVTAGSNYGPARASSDFFLGNGGVRLSDLDLDAGGVTAQGSIALINGAPSSANLTFDAKPGAFLASGEANGEIRLTEGAGAETAVLEVHGRNVRFAGSGYVIRSLDLSGEGTLNRLPFSLNVDVGGDTPLTFDGDGVYSRTAQAQTVTLNGDGSVREIDFTTREAAVIALAADGRVVRVDLGIGGGFLTGSLRQDRAGAVIQADLTRVDLSTIAPDLRGSVTGRVSLRGAGDDLSGSANVTLAGVRSVDGPEDLAVDGFVNARLVSGALEIEAQAQDEGVVRAHANLTLPVEASAAPLRLAVARERAMSGDVSIQGQIQPIWDLFLGGERRLAGLVNAEATIEGTINAPRLNGGLSLTEGTFRDTASGLRLADVTLAATFNDTLARIETFTATDGARGTVSGNGRLSLTQGGGSSFTLQLTRFRLIDNEIAEATASGPITVTRGTDGNILLEGDVAIDEAEIAANPPGSRGVVRMDVTEINRPGGDPVGNGEERANGPQIGLDIRLRSPGGDVFVRGRGLNVEMNVNARVRGTLGQPLLTGTARVVRGDYEFAGKRFVFDTTGSVSLSTNPQNIRLDLRAVRDDPTLTAVVRVTGTAASPEIALTSTPALPQDEILSQVLFGRSASQLSGFEAAQLAAGVASLAGGGGFDVLGNLREFAGLDRLSFGGDASALTVAGGRYLTDDVYFEIIGGGEGGAAVQVEWQVRRNIAVTSRVDGQGDANLSIRWRNQTRQPGTGRRDRRPNRE